MSKTTYIILGIVAVLAVIAAIYFYNKSKQTTVVVVPPTQQQNPQQQGIFNLINGIGQVLQNVNWQSIFGGNKTQTGNRTYQGACPEGQTFNTTTGQCQ